MTADELKKFFPEEKLLAVQKARDYYAGKNDILQRERTIAVKNQKIPLNHLANNRLAHPFLRKLIDQKIGYLLSLPFSFSTEDHALSEALSVLFDKGFFRLLKVVAKDAIVCGCGWIAVYYDEEGELRLKRLAPETVAPEYDEEDIDKISRVFRKFKKEGKDVYEIWSKDGVSRYLEEGNELIELEKRGHFRQGEEEFNWQRLPILQFRYNADALPLLDFVKPLIDDYDERVSDVANLLADTPNNIKIVRGYVDDPAQFIKNLATLNCLFLGPDGDVSNLENKLDIETHVAHLDRLRKDIYSAGSGVDSQDNAVGDLSGTAIRYRYSELDLDCKSMGAEFAEALEDLVWFVAQDLKNKGRQIADPNVDIAWNTDHIINELQTVQILAASKGLISDQTIIENHPYVGDAEKERQRMLEELTNDNTLP